MMMVLCLFTTLVSFGTIASRNETITYRSISLNVNGREIAPCDVSGSPTEPFIRNLDGSTYLPVRAVAGALGLNVGWSDETSTVMLTSDGSLNMSQSSPVKSNRAVNTLLTYRNIRVTLDGQVVTLKNVTGQTIEPFIMNGSTYIPVRAVAAALGCEVGWDDRTSTVILVSEQKTLEQRILMYQIKANQGDAEAAYNLGCCYYYGQGVPQDYEEAVYWYWVASERGHAKAQYNLGLCFYYGQGVVSQSYSDAVMCFKRAADQGMPEAQYNLALCYSSGKGVTQNQTEAVSWYRKAAEQGYAPAQNNLGVCYYSGKGVQKNETQAFNWFKKAAEQALAEAEYNLGICYEYGIGVTKNLTEANKWYDLAKQHGHA